MPDSFETYLSIAGIGLRIQSDQPLQKKDTFLPFLSKDGPVDFEITLRETDQLPPLSDRILHADYSSRIHSDGMGNYIRSFYRTRQDPLPYAVTTYDFPGNRVQVDYLPAGSQCVTHMNNSFLHIGLEALLIQRQRLCLHASCVDTHLGGILFSGVSGIGKSTQAALWCEHRNATQINGDRPILSRGHNGWLAWGSPYAGSSHCHINTNCSVTAVIMLKQTQHCTLRRLAQPEAFRAIWSGLTIHSWDEKFVETASVMTLDLIGAVPVFEFGCTPDVQAVDYLEQELRKECCL